MEDVCVEDKWMELFCVERCVCTRELRELGGAGVVSCDMQYTTLDPEFMLIND